MSYTRVTKREPCPICQKPDWCRVFADGWTECMRVQSDKPAKSGGWMHRHWQSQLPSAEASRFRPMMRPKPVVPAINATKLMRGWWSATDDGQREALARELGVSTASLVSVGAAWAAPYRAWAFPMCDGYGNVIGVRLRNERGKFAVRGSRQGIFLANAPPQKTLFICEGPTDTAAALELGLFAAGRPNCCCGGPELRIHARRQECRRAVIIADNDKPGLDGAHKVGRELRLAFAVYVPPARDMREFVRLGGTRVMIENTLKSTVWNK